MAGKSKALSEKGLKALQKLSKKSNKSEVKKAYESLGLLNEK